MPTIPSKILRFLQPKGRQKAPPEAEVSSQDSEESNKIERNYSKDAEPENNFDAKTIDDVEFVVKCPAELSKNVKVFIYTKWSHEERDPISSNKNTLLFYMRRCDERKKWSDVSVRYGKDRATIMDLWCYASDQGDSDSQSIVIVNGELKDAGKSVPASAVFGKGIAQGFGKFSTVKRARFPLYHHYLLFVDVDNSDLNGALARHAKYVWNTCYAVKHSRSMLGTEGDKPKGSAAKAIEDRFASLPYGSEDAFKEIQTLLPLKAFMDTIRENTPLLNASTQTVEETAKSPPPDVSAQRFTGPGFEHTDSEPKSSSYESHWFPKYIEDICIYRRIELEGNLSLSEDQAKPEKDGDKEEREAEIALQEKTGLQASLDFDGPEKVALMLCIEPRSKPDQLQHGVSGKAL